MYRGPANVPSIRQQPYFDSALDNQLSYFMGNGRLGDLYCEHEGGGRHDYYRVGAVLTSQVSMAVLKAWEEIAETASWGTEFHRRMAEGKRDCLWDSVREWGVYSLVPGVRVPWRW